MKMRIQGPSLRLRLKQGEVDTLAKLGRVEAAIPLGSEAGARIVYAVITSAGTETIGVRYRDGEITVVLPRAVARDWAASDRVGLEHRLPLTDAETLHILVEKDFRCLHQRPHENEADNYPHPEA